MTLFVNCPNCEGQVAWTQNNIFRPFCSEYCKNVDLGAWAQEKYVIQAMNSPDESEEISIDSSTDSAKLTTE